MADDLKQFAAKLDRLGHALDGSSLRQITTRVATKSKMVAIPAIQPNTLSHWGRGGKKGGYHVQARYVVLSDHEAALRPTVPPLAALLEEGSGSTWKAPRRRGAKRRKRGTVGTYTRTPVPARHAWSKVAPPVAAKVPGFVDEEVQRVLRGIF
jgi:hypothetical protein